MRRLLALVAFVLVCWLLLSAAVGATPTEPSSAAPEAPHGYDAPSTATTRPANTRIGATRIERPDAGPSRSLTSPVTRFRAAESGVRLRPGVVQPGVARSLQSALNPQAYIDDVVGAYGINLRGSGQAISVVYNPRLASAGRVRQAAPDVIEVGPLGMSSSQELARTIAHELNHSRSLLRGGSAPERTAWAAEDALSSWLAGGR